jgi:hypothetical protein
VSDEKESFQGKISKKMTRTTEKVRMLLSGRRQPAPFQSLYEWVRVVLGFNKNHGHPCRPLTNRYVRLRGTTDRAGGQKFALNATRASFLLQILCM